MVGELNNNAPQLQQAVNNPFQQEQNNRIQDRQAREAQRAEIQPASESAANDVNNETNVLQASTSNNNAENLNNSRAPRGSVLDITV